MKYYNNFRKGIFATLNNKLKTKKDKNGYMI